MNWIKVSLKTRPEALPALEAIFLEYTGGILLEGTESEPVIAAYFPAPLSAELERELQAKIAKAREAGLDPGSELLEKELVLEENWATEWKKYYNPLPVGKRFLICPSWKMKEEPGRISIALDPGQAFGTGYHPTTQLCLQLLEDTAPGTTAYDLGTGSGILAIALAKLGAKVAAFEADPVAVAAAKANAELNRVELEIVELDLLTAPPPKRPAQLVVANLTADLFLALGNKLADYLEPDGKLIAGGIASRREQEVKEVFREAGIMIQEAAFDGEWVCLAGRKQRGE